MPMIKLANCAVLADYSQWFNFNVLEAIVTNKLGQTSTYLAVLFQIDTDLVRRRVSNCFFNRFLDNNMRPEDSFASRGPVRHTEHGDPFVLCLSRHHVCSLRLRAIARRQTVGSSRATMSLPFVVAARSAGVQRRVDTTRITPAKWVSECCDLKGVVPCV